MQRSVVVQPPLPVLSHGSLSSRSLFDRPMLTTDSPYFRQTIQPPTQRTIAYATMETGVGITLQQLPDGTVRISGISDRQIETSSDVRVGDLIGTIDGITIRDMPLTEGRTGKCKKCYDLFCRSGENVEWPQF